MSRTRAATAAAVTALVFLSVFLVRDHTRDDSLSADEPVHIRVSATRQELLIRVTENTAGQPWNQIRAELQRQHAVTWTGPAGTFRQATDLTKPQRDIYTALSIEPPKKILALDPAQPAS